jgi:small conductance mechanosensitive channel
MIKIVDLRRTGYARDLQELSRVLSDLGLESSEYRSLALIVTGDATKILDTGVLATLAKQWSKAGVAWVNQNGLGLTLNVLFFLLIIFAFRGLSRLTRRWVERGVNKVNLSSLLRNMIIAVVANSVLAIGVMIALSQMGVSLGPLLAGLGVAGFIVGFALQDTLGNFASGMMILVYRPYDVGDIITAGGISGKVEDMSLVYTVVLTFDNQKMIVPNSKIWGDVIQNVTSQRVRRVDLVFGIAYSDDIDKAERVLAEIVDDNEMTLDDPKPTIKLHTLNESSVDFVVRPWVKSADYWDVYWDITRAVKKRFDEEGISIPFPQRDVHHFYDE